MLQRPDAKGRSGCEVLHVLGKSLKGGLVQEPAVTGTWEAGAGHAGSTESENPHPHPSAHPNLVLRQRPGINFN